MYSNKQNVLQLVALMRSHGVKKCVLCPGSRDIPIVQSILQCEDFTTYSVTDERSAGFFAIGLSLQTDCKEAVAVVVTSGSALLGLHPAVSEAFYQNVPLLVISADRPAAWIGQMDGQTLPQVDVFKTLVRKSVGLVEVQSEEDRWFNNRMINEALLDLHHQGKGPVHINVPISDPFFEFSTPELPEERVITRFTAETLVNIDLLDQGPAVGRYDAGFREYYSGKGIAKSELTKCSPMRSLIRALNKFKRIMLIVGQSPSGISTFDSVVNDVSFKLWSDISLGICNFYESPSNILSYDMEGFCMPDLLVSQTLTYEDGSYRKYLPVNAVRYGADDSGIEAYPELVITLGGHIISKNLKKFVRSQKPKCHIHVSAGGEVVDLFKCLSTVVQMEPRAFLDLLAEAVGKCQKAAPYSSESKCDSLPKEMQDSLNELNALGIDWNNVNAQSHYVRGFKELDSYITYPHFGYSHMLLVEVLLYMIPEHSVLHLANSSTVRYAQLFSFSECCYLHERGVKVMANRGVNGIEGSLSTAIGYAAASDKINFIVIGDLSFFYDMNALWNGHVGNNVRILLLNNGGGEIFHALPGLKLSDKEKHYVTAQHQTDAQAWATSRGFEYHQVTNEDSVIKVMESFCSEERLNAPQFVEVITQAESDAAMLKQVLSDCRMETIEDIEYY